MTDEFSIVNSAVQHKSTRRINSGEISRDDMPLITHNPDDM